MSVDVNALNVAIAKTRTNIDILIEETANTVRIAEMTAQRAIDHATAVVQAADAKIVAAS